MIRKLKLSAGIERAKFNMLASRQYEANLSRMADITRGMSIPIIFFFQPIMYLEKNFITKHEKNNWGMADGHKSYVDAMQKMYPVFEESVLSLNKLSGVNAYSLKTIFKDFKEDAYIDEAHYTARGNRLIAEKMSEILDKYCK